MARHLRSTANIVFVFLMLHWDHSLGQEPPPTPAATSLATPAATSTPTQTPASILPTQTPTSTPAPTSVPTQASASTNLYTATGSPATPQSPAAQQSSSPPPTLKDLPPGPPPPSTQPPPASQPPPPLVCPLPGVTYCGSVPATPAYCAVTLPNGQFVGGVECGNTIEGQYIYFAQSPGESCTNSCQCGSGRACTTLGPIGTPRFCYYIAPASCFTAGLPLSTAIPPHGSPPPSTALPPDSGPPPSTANPPGSTSLPSTSAPPGVSIGLLPPSMGTPASSPPLVSSPLPLLSPSTLPPGVYLSPPPPIVGVSPYALPPQHAEIPPGPGTSPPASQTSAPTPAPPFELVPVRNDSIGGAVCAFGQPYFVKPSGDGTSCNLDPQQCFTSQAVSGPQDALCQYQNDNTYGFHDDPSNSSSPLHFVPLRFYTAATLLCSPMNCTSDQYTSGYQSESQEIANNQRTLAYVSIGWNWRCNSSLPEDSQLQGVYCTECGTDGKGLATLYIRLRAKYTYNSYGYPVQTIPDSYLYFQVPFPFEDRYGDQCPAKTAIPSSNTPSFQATYLDFSPPVIAGR